MLAKRGQVSAEVGRELPGAGGGAGLADPPVLRVLVGAKLRRLREAAGITPEQAGYEIRASGSKISRMETGRVGFKRRDVEDLLILYGVTAVADRQEVLGLADRTNAAPWWAQYGDAIPAWLESYLGMESAASVIRSFEAQFVPGLFQTEAYIRAVAMAGSASEEQINRRVEARLKRQDVLRGPDPPQVWVVIDEAALRRPAGSRDLMIAQLSWLIELAGWPHITLQVVPFSHGAHAGAGGAFTLLRFDEADLPDTVYIEHLTSALYLSKRADVEHYLEVMNALSAQALTVTDTIRFLRQIIKET